jgi:hypothetical protein
LDAPEEAEEEIDKFYESHVKMFDKHITEVESLKTKRNDALARNDAAGAVKGYTDAIERMMELMQLKKSPEQEARAKRLMAVCLSNRAAVYLSPEKIMECDPLKAAADGESAVRWDKTYAKGSVYFCRHGGLLPHNIPL